METSLELHPSGARLLARPLTETERSWLKALVITAGSVVFFGIVYLIELRLGRWNPRIRLVRDPAGAAMVFLGISHFLVALFFTATSKSMRSARARGSFAGMLALGAGICALYARLEQASAFLATAFFAAYFLAHDFRDQVFFYFTNRDSVDRTDRAALESVLFWTPFLFGAAAAAAIAVPASRLFPDGSFMRDGILKMEGPALFLFPALAILLVVFAVTRLRRLAGLGPEKSLLLHLRMHRPIYAVFAGSILVLLLGVALRATGSFTRLIVLMHVASWYVFSIRQIESRAGSGSKASSTIAWLKTTLPGFRLIHIGSAAALVIVAFFWAYPFRNDPSFVPAYALLEPDHFAYWTILHVTVSFRAR
jgi:hypothetical protein